MTETPHFYTVGGTLPPTARSYVTRLADEMLLQHLLRGDFCYVLTSRQMGKSSLMVRTAGALRQNGVAVAVLDLTRLGQNLTPEQWYDGLLVRLGAELKIADELEEYWEQDRVGRLGPMQRFIGALREAVLPSHKGNFVIFIDEIDSVRSLPFSSDEFFAGIRELYNGRVSDPELERISFCLLGVAQPSDLISNVNITPFNIGHRIELTDFTEVEAQPLLEGLAGATGTAETNTNNAAILRRVLYWTGGHPYLTQRLCEALAQSGKSVTRADVDRVCEELFLSSRSREKEDNLLFVRDRVLSEKEDRSTVLDLYAKALRGKKIKDDDANPTIDVLRLSGIVSVSQGYLTVRNRIYSTVFNRNWVIANMPDAELRRQRAAYRRGLGFAATIGLVVLTIIGILGAFAYRSAEGTLREQYFADIGAAQQAFENGDMKTGDAIVAQWNPSRPDSWLQRPKYWWRKYAYDRPTLVNSFAFHLLAQEQGRVPDPHVFPGSGNRNSNGPEKHTGCNEFRAVASTFRNGEAEEVVAAGGADGIVYLWDASDGKNPHPIGALELGAEQSGDPDLPYQFQPDSANLPSCAEIQKSGRPAIMSLSFSPHGRRLAISTGSWGNQEEMGHVLLWNMDDRSQVRDLHANFTGAADSNVFSSDGKFLVASGEDDKAELWPLSGLHALMPRTTFDPRQQVELGGVRRLVGNGANAVALSTPDRHLMALGYGDGHLILYDDRVPDAPLFNQIVHVSGIMSLLFIDDKNLAVGTRDGDLLIFTPDDLIADARKGKPATPLYSLPTAQGILQALATSPDHNHTWLATSGSDGTIILWSWPALERVEIFRGHKGRVYSVAFCIPEETSETSQCVVSASQDGDIRVWDLPHAGVQEEDVTPHRLLVHGQAIGLAYPALGTVVVGVGTTTEVDYTRSGDIVVWHPSTESVHPTQVDGGAPIVSFDVSPDGEFVATSSRNQNLVLQGVKDQKPADPLPVGVTLSSIHITCFSAEATDKERTCPDREYLVAGIADTSDRSVNGQKPGGLCLWRVLDHGQGRSPRFAIAQGNINPCLRSGKADHLTDFQTLVSTVTAMAFSRDGKEVATSLIKDDGTHVYVWESRDLMDRKLIFQHQSRAFPEQFYQMAFSYDGSYLAGTTVTSGLYYWLTAETDNAPISEQKKYAASADTSSDANREYSAFDLSARGMALAFAPPPYHVLAVGLEDSRIVLWSTTYHRVIMQIHRHSGGVQAVAFSPDGSQFASAGNDGHVILLQDSDPARKK